MKKFFSTIAIALIPFISISAQSEEPKQYLPEQGDMAIGFSATPVLKYVGNIFNNTSDNELAPLGGIPASKGFFDEYNYENLAPTVSVIITESPNDMVSEKSNCPFELFPPIIRVLL